MIRGNGERAPRSSSSDFYRALLGTVVPLVSMVLISFSTPAIAQTTAPAAPSQEPAASQAPASRWASQCVSDSRQSPPECSLQQSAVATNNGQLLASVTVRVPPDRKEVIALFQVPTGAFLPAGISYQVDDGPNQSAPFQACDGQGCYASVPLQASTVISMKGGTHFAVSFQNLAKKPIGIPFELAGFSAGLAKIQ